MNNEDLESFKKIVIQAVQLGLKSRAATLHFIYNDVIKLRDKGYPLATILKTMEDAGLKFSTLASFKTTMYRLEENAKKQ